MVRFFALALVLSVASGPAAAIAQSCKDFKTCDEAMKSFKAGNKKLDRDKDGVPCESLYGQR